MLVRQDDLDLGNARDAQAVSTVRSQFSHLNALVVTGLMVE